MFDPNRDAAKEYHPANGALEGSWEALDRRVVLANWDGGEAKASLGFFAKRGRRQVMAGDNDGDDNFAARDAASRGVPGVIGFMETTWQSRYDDPTRCGRATTGAEQGARPGWARTAIGAEVS